MNGGTCANQINQYFCTCSTGFTGLNCEIGMNLYELISIFNITYLYFLMLYNNLIN